MSSQPTPTSEREYSRKPTYSKNRHPHYFGQYLNQARHNAYMIIADLEDEYDILREGEKDKLKEDRLAESPLFDKLYNPASDRRPDETARLLRDLTRQFPFLQCLETNREGEPVGAPPRDVKKALTQAFALLNQLRNRYSHFGHPEVGLWQFPLLSVYRKAVARLRPRFSHYTEADIQHLSPETGNPAHLPNDPTKEAYNEKALIFFTCLFLERDEASRFISRLYGFHDTSTLPRRATLDAYREFCCQLPQPKLESSDILLDMFNELARCPGELYASLSEDDRKQFQRTPDLGDAESPDDVPPVVFKRHSDRFPWFALRYFDEMEVFPTLRFQIQLAQFAMGRYEKKINAELRERVLLRPLRVFARWQQVDTTDLRRSLDMLSDDKEKSKLLEKTLPDSWRVLERGKWQLRAEIEQFATRYRFDDNCIGIRFVPEGEQHGFPELPTERDARGRYQFSPADQPDAVISTYELAALFLHQRLHGAAQSEAFIQDYIRRFRALCADMKAGKVPPAEVPPFVQKTPKNEPRKPKDKELLAQSKTLREKRFKETDAMLEKNYGIPLRYLPDAFREYLLGYRKDSYRHAALEKLKAKLRETRNLMKDIGYVKEKIIDERTGKEKEIENLKLPTHPDMRQAPKSGDIGSWLAEDIVFLKQPDRDRRGKPNDAQYVILQKMLALFGGYREQLAPYFEELGLAGKNAEAPHPFLDKVSLKDCNSILTFYDRYLWARFDYVEAAIRDIDPEFGVTPFKKKGIKGLEEDEIRQRYGHVLPIEEKTALEKEYSGLPIFLPRGLFNAANEVALRKMGKLQPEDKTANMILGLDRYSGGSAQPMYELPRYMLPPGERGERGEPVEVKKYLAWIKTEQKRLSGSKNLRPAEDDLKKSLGKEANRLYEREQVIRYTQALDRALWFMAIDRAARRSKEFNMDFAGKTLRDIEQVLTSEIHVGKQIGHVTLNDQLTIRRYGEMRRVLKDRRLGNLLAHFTQPRHVEHEDIKKAFEQHERRRIPFFERVYKFEKIIFEHFESEVWSHFNGRNNRGYFEHWDYLTPAYEKLTDESALGVGRLNLGDLRNMLIHNEVPLPELLPLPTDTASCVHLVDSIFDQTQGYYDRLLELLGLPAIELDIFTSDNVNHV